MILAGFVVSHTLIWFLLSFVLASYWYIELLDPAISLIFVGFIFSVVLMNSIGGYFWALANIPRKKATNLAILNSLPLWVLIVLQPELQTDLFFPVIFFVLNIACAALGNWFGVRMFYE